jgi:DtxR family Mn-dependent transcriptional regulator
MTTKVTFAMRRYAAEIFRLQEDVEYVGLSDLAEEVHTSLQSASRMIARLKSSGLVEHEPYRGVRLTTAGETIAMPAIRRHRLAELFLVRQLGFGWDEVHEMTDQFELGLNERIEDHIDMLLGHPSRCPHGEPIPDKAGNLPQLQDRSLVELETGNSYRISRVRVHEPAKLRYLADLQLLPGAEFRLLSFSPFAGPVRILIGHSEQVLSFELAASLWVLPA